MATKKDLKYYLGLNWSYTIEQDFYRRKKFYIIRVNELPGVCTDANTIEEGMQNIQDAIIATIELYLEQGDNGTVTMDVKTTHSDISSSSKNGVVLNPTCRASRVFT